MPHRYFLVFFTLLSLLARAQAPTPSPQDDVFVDAKGVLRWRDTSARWRCRA